VAKTAQLVPTPILGPMSIGAGVGLAVSVLIMLAVEIGRGTVGTRGQLNYIVKLATHRKT
jgi:acetyltransferase-like isoleucine patch superfamily enzyme